MRVAIINTKPTARAHYLLKSFETGILAAGDSTVWVEDAKDYRMRLLSCDVGVQVCFANRWHQNSDLGLFRLDVDRVLREAGKRLITIDTGFVCNQTDFELRLGATQRRIYWNETAGAADPVQHERYRNEVYYEVGYDGLKRHAAYYARGVGRERWRQLEKLGAAIKPWRRKGDHILVLGQTFHGLSSQHVDIYDWYAAAIREVRKRTSRPIVFRQHPRMTKLRSQGKGRRSDASKGRKDRNTIESRLRSIRGLRWTGSDLIQSDLRNCWAVLAFTTNAAVAAVLAGIPLFAGDPGCMAYDVANTSLKRIEKPLLPDRETWAHELAYCQWTPREMEEGLPWQHLRPYAREKIGHGRFSELSERTEA